MNDIIETVTHELVHVGERTFEWSHNEAFFDKQKKLLARAMQISDRLEAELDDVVENYEGTYLGGKAFCEYMVAN